MKSIHKRSKTQSPPVASPTTDATRKLSLARARASGIRSNVTMMKIPPRAKELLGGLLGELTDQLDTLTSEVHAATQFAPRSMGEMQMLDADYARTILSESRFRLLALYARHLTSLVDAEFGRLTPAQREIICESDVKEARRSLSHASLLLCQVEDNREDKFIDQIVTQTFGGATQNEGAPVGVKPEAGE